MYRRFDQISQVFISKKTFMKAVLLSMKLVDISKLVVLALYIAIEKISIANFKFFELKAKKLENTKT